uniref:Tudor domain-containing protein n=1 Tax=Gouania willdenowi TaxID=441366 RepID=A0A8C5DSL7_GOUWI
GCEAPLADTAGESLLWSVNLKLTHLDWTPEATLVHFQGHYLNTCELDYKILHGEIQRTAKTKAEVDIGEFCLVEDVTSASWFRGRVQGQTNDLFEVYLIDHGNILTVDATYRPHVSSELFTLPPKVVCGFFANVLLVRNCPHLLVDKYFSCLVGQSITGYVQARLPYEVLVLEVPDINSDLVLHGFGRLVDRDTFLLLVELLTEVTVKRSMESEIDTPFDQSKEVELFIKPSFWTKYKDVLKCAESKLICGTRAKVQLTAALYHRMFFFQMVGVERELCKISEKLALMCEHGNQQQRRGSAEKISLLCSVKGKDGNWYRGFLSFFPVSSHVKVLFVDYGFFETVSVDNIRRLPEEFLLTPIMALPCSLSMKGQVKMPKSQLLNLLKSSLQGGVLDVEISGFDDEHHLYYLTVSGVEDDPVKEPQPFQMAPLTKYISLKSVVHSDANETKNVKYSQKRATAIGRTTKQIKKSNKNDKKAPVARTFKALEIKPGWMLTIRCFSFISVKDFWCQSLNKASELKVLNDKIHQYYSAHTVALQAEDSCCVAKSPVDNKWYRGLITERENRFATVLLVDYGYTIQVDQQYLQAIMPEFVHLERQAFRCCLYNPQTSAGFKDFCDWSPVMCKLKTLCLDNENQGMYYVVDLHDSQTQQSLINSVIKLGITMQETAKEQSAVSPESFIFSSYDLRPGMEEQVFVTHVSNQWEVYCHLERNADIIHKLEENISELSHELNNDSTRTVVQMLCLAKYLDGNWYRAVLQNNPSPFHVSVVYVDYGNTHVLEKSEVMSIPKGCADLLYTPMQALRFHLDLVPKEESSVNVKEWLKKAVLNKSARAIIVGLNESGSFNVELFCEERSINEKVKELFHKIEKETFSRVSVHVDTKNKEAQTRERKASKKPIPLKSDSAHKFFFRKLLEEAMTAEGLGADSVFEGFVVGAQNPNKFWIRTQKRNDEFNEMMAGIGDYFRQVKLDEEILLNPEPRDLCCAMYEKDMHFYRAVVTDKLVHGAEVLFIDFGNIEKVPTMLIKNIPKAFAKIPGFAIDCTLANLILCDDIWPVAVCDFFRQAVFNKSLQVHVVQMEKNQLAVDLNEMERGESQSIAKLLVTSDKAEYISLKSVVHSDANETKNVKYSQKRATAIGRTTKQIKKSNKNDKKAPVARTFKALEIKPGWMLTIRCFSFISVKDFWCQSLNKASELKVLNDKIHQYYSAHTVALQAEDSCCVAKSPVDNKWYRGLITERENRFATVLLVDYGYTIQVDQQYLQAIMPEFVHLERQAFRCCLYNPQTSAGFKDFCDWSPVMCKLKNIVRNHTDGMQCLVVSQLDNENQGMALSTSVGSGRSLLILSFWPPSMLKYVNK